MLHPEDVIMCDVNGDPVFHNLPLLGGDEGVHVGVELDDPEVDVVAGGDVMVGDVIAHASDDSVVPITYGNENKFRMIYL